MKREHYGERQQQRILNKCFPTPHTKYYKNRLWKITYEVGGSPTHGNLQLKKWYEKRTAIGEPWDFVRGVHQVLNNSKPVV